MAVSNPRTSQLKDERLAALDELLGDGVPEPGRNIVDVYVGYLRRKLGRDVIETVRGLGYRFNDTGG